MPAELPSPTCTLKSAAGGNPDGPTEVRLNGGYWFEPKHGGQAGLGSKVIRPLTVTRTMTPRGSVIPVLVCGMPLTELSGGSRVNVPRVPPLALLLARETNWGACCCGVPSREGSSQDTVKNTMSGTTRRRVMRRYGIALNHACAGRGQIGRKCGANG